MVADATATSSTVLTAALDGAINRCYLASHDGALEVSGRVSAALAETMFRYVACSASLAIVKMHIQGGRPAKHFGALPHGRRVRAWTGYQIDS